MAHSTKGRCPSLRARLRLAYGDRRVGRRARTGRSGGNAMRVVANSVPKSGTHLLDRLLVLLGFGLVDLGGLRPHLAKSDDRFPMVNGRLRRLMGLRKPEDVMGIGPHLVEGGR